TASEIGADFQTRRSIRRYRNEPVSRDVIIDLLNQAIWAPSAHNRQPWRFAVVDDVVQKEALARAMGDRLRRDLQADYVPEDVIEADVSRSYRRITSAPVVIILSLSMIDMDVYPDERRNWNEFLMAVQSTAMAGQNFMLAAHRTGLGTCWMCAPLFSGDVVKESLELPDDWQPQALITVGYPAEVREKTRKPLEASVIWR
ncbi:MAG: nitroreductase family protein, partial [Anaerolineae bacterium]|nr:nitroreductase family protein [Anaerolineae bacterium]